MVMHNSGYEYGITATPNGNAGYLTMGPHDIAYIVPNGSSFAANSAILDVLRAMCELINAVENNRDRWGTVAERLRG